MKTSKTKKRFLLSLVAVIACVAMLVGTTMAWFTDSVTSGKNVITAGNLDIELTHSNGQVTDENVEGQTDLFALDYWEPGAVAYENFTVKNVGNLALKYKLQLGLYDYNTITIDNEQHSLADVLKVFVQQGTFSGTREDAIALVEGGNVGENSINDFAKESKLGPKGSESANDVYSVIIYWKPTDNDNLYNVNNGKTVDTLHDGKNELFVEFGVHLVATQDTVEADIFDEFYDKDSTYDVMPNFKKATGSGNTSRSSDNNAGKTENDLEIEINAKDLTGSTVKLGDAQVPKKAIDGVLDDFLDPMPTPEGDTVIKDDVVLTLNVETKSSDSKATVLDITMSGEAVRTKIVDGGEPEIIVSKTGAITELDAPVLVPLTLPAGLKNIKATHTHTSSTGVETITEMTKVDNKENLENGQFWYNEETGEFLAKMDKFSNVSISYDPIADVARIGGVGYSSLYNAFAESAEGDIVTMLQNSNMNAVSKTNIALDLNGKSVSKVYVQKSTLNVEGKGSLSTTVGTASMLNVNGGELENLEIAGNGYVNFYDAIYNDVRFDEESNPELKVYGGKYHITSEATKQKIENGIVDGKYLKAIPEQENWYTVAPFEDYHVAKIGNKPYNTLADALVAAKDNDIITILKDITENVTVTSAGERSNDNLVIDLSGKTLNGSIKFYDCDTVTVKNGSINGYFTIGEHKYTNIKWKYADQYPLQGYHPLAPAKNISLENLNVDSGDHVMFYYTNIEDDLTRGAPSNYVDNDLYGRYIYKTGYTTQEQSDYKKYDEVFTACSDKDLVTIKGGTYKCNGNFTGNMINRVTNIDEKATRYTEVLNVVSGTFSNDSLGYYVDSSQYLLGTNNEGVKEYTVVTTEPENYVAKVNNNYYNYVGGANDAIIFADFESVIYTKESADAEKKFNKNDFLTIVFEEQGLTYTGAVPEDKYEILTKPSETVENGTVFYSKFSAVAAVYATGQGGDWKKATKVGEYATLKDAVSALQSNYTIVILKDFTVGDEMSYSYGGGTYKCAAGYASRSTIDFNGHMITYTGTGSCIVSSQSTGYLYIRDTSAEKTGGIIATNGNCFRMMNANSDYTNFYDVNFTAEKGYALQLEGGTGITINSGRYISKYQVNQGWKVTTLKISGGTFNYQPNTLYIASGKSAYDNEDGTWTIK